MRRALVVDHFGSALWPRSKSGSGSFRSAVAKTRGRLPSLPPERDIGKVCRQGPRRHRQPGPHAARASRLAPRRRRRSHPPLVGRSARACHVGVSSGESLDGWNASTTQIISPCRARLAPRRSHFLFAAHNGSSAHRPRTRETGLLGLSTSRTHKLSPSVLCSGRLLMAATLLPATIQVATLLVAAAPRVATERYASSLCRLLRATRSARVMPASMLWS